MTKAIYILCAVALVAGCKAKSGAGQGNEVIPSAETRTPAAVSLDKPQALALMKQRHDHMEALGKATKAIHDQLGSSSPDVASIQQSAAQIDDLAPKLRSWFPAGTGPDVGKTRAKPKVWQKPEDFTVKAHDFEQAATDFDVAAKRGDLAQIKAGFATLGKSCKACHDDYRAPEKH